MFRRLRKQFKENPYFLAIPLVALLLAALGITALVDPAALTSPSDQTPVTLRYVPAIYGSGKCYYAASEGEVPNLEALHICKPTDVNVQLTPEQLEEYYAFYASADYLAEAAPKALLSVQLLARSGFENYILGFNSGSHSQAIANDAQSAVYRDTLTGKLCTGAQLGISSDGLTFPARDDE